MLGEVYGPNTNTNTEEEQLKVHRQIEKYIEVESIYIDRIQIDRQKESRWIDRKSPDR